MPTPTPSWYEHHILPTLLDWACSMKPIQAQRAQLLPRAQGRVMEVGVGTGLNLPFYDARRVRRLVGVDPGLQMHPLALRRSRAAGLPLELMGLSAEKLPVEDASFDTVVSTYTLCTIPDPVAALREMRRVLAPGGRLLFCEHGLAPDPRVQRWQARLAPLWSRVAGGCQLSRDIPALLQEAGFQAEVHPWRAPGPGVLGFHCWGEAVVT